MGGAKLVFGLLGVIWLWVKTVKTRISWLTYRHHLRTLSDASHKPSHVVGWLTYPKGQATRWDLPGVDPAHPRIRLSDHPWFAGRIFRSAPAVDDLTWSLRVTLCQGLFVHLASKPGTVQMRSWKHKNRLVCYSRIPFRGIDSIFSYLYIWPLFLLVGGRVSLLARAEEHPNPDPSDRESNISCRKNGDLISSCVPLNSTQKT